MLAFIKNQWMMIVFGLGVAMTVTIRVLLGIVKRQKHEIKIKDKQQELVESQDEFEKQHDLEEEKANEELKNDIGIVVDTDKWNRL